MAAPASKTIGDLNGKWVLNKTLSDPVDPALSLQGVSWLVRKAVGAATVTLDTKQYRGAPTPPNASAEPVTRVDIQQIATAGLRGTAENRCLDYVFREHSDWLFGKVRGRSRWVGAGELAALVEAEDGEFRKTGVVEDAFVARDWLEGEEEKGGPEGETHILNHVESLDAGWTALQVWGFQNVGGERRYVRNVVVAKDGKFVNFKMVYDWVPE
ncbi:uncharacterized protein F4812DRAFT_437105 [Daldinia caldariorum]|uniref:uncharacterized protein n=1 Tax=Daldinia caldariorum TaxID=326644 RepID=UPI002007B4DB|nr:uncharacterized protein F4812DRAFT_437105 [Daldinia caldariorum]KAI1465683.1 hypothetical protein F4812DRAFT_437105 [Daldinia caldariorum]